jgi:metal-responsive CopG/Arc/MetJ family transcriptional regulator
MADLRLPTPWAKRYPAMVVRVSPEMLEKIDRWAVRKNVSRSEAVRTFIDWGLSAESAQ